MPFIFINSYNIINTSLCFYTQVQMRTASLNYKYIKPTTTQTNQIYIASIAKQKHRSISCKINKDNQLFKFQTRPDKKMQIFQQIVDNKKRMVFNMLKRIFKIKQKHHETLFLFDALQKGSLQISKYKQLLINKPIYNYINLNIPKNNSQDKQKTKIFIKKIENVLTNKIKYAFISLKRVGLKKNQDSFDKQNLQDTYEDKMTTTFKSFKSSEISYFKNNLCSIEINQNSRNSSQRSRSRKNSTSNIINVTFTTVQGSPSLNKSNKNNYDQKNKISEFCLESPIQNQQKTIREHKSTLLNKEKYNQIHISQRRKRYTRKFLQDEFQTGISPSKISKFYQ